MSSEGSSVADARPTSVDALGAALAAASTAGRVIGVRGSGSKAGWGAVGRPVEQTIETGGLSAIVEHAAGDLVVTAQAGVTLAALQDHVASAGQWLALDPPEPGATIGGVVATAASGPRRLRYGTPRDLLIGITVVLADGTVARSGGKVVKNVAGYDLGKLFTGSYGTLGVIAECTFRLHPLAPARRVVASRPADLGAALAALRETGTVPTAVEWDGGRLITVFETIEAAAVEQARVVAAVLGGDVGDELPAGFGERPWRSGEVGLKVTHRLGAVTASLAAVDAVVPGARVSAHAGSGVIWVAYPATDLAEVEALRAAVAAYDGGVVVVDAPVEAKARVDVWGPARGLDVMRQIKARFDPAGCLSPGCFVGGI